jgi:O-antigen/teichoic acid export membrane protein
MARTAASESPRPQIEQPAAPRGAAVHSPIAADAVAFAEHRNRTSRFVSNVMWGLLGVGVNLAIGLCLSPLIVRRLGIEQYGVWVLLFSAADYLRILDFGFRSSVVNACARLRTRGDWDGINQTLTTALAYFFAGSAGCWILAVLCRGPVVATFNVAAPMQATALTLVGIVAATVSVRLMFAPITAVLEAFERFDLLNRAYIAGLILRATGSLGVLLAGRGLIELACVVLLVQVFEAAWNITSVHRILPTFRPSFDHIRFDTLKRLSRYGRYSALMAAADLMSLHGAITLLGAIRGPGDVAAYALPFRLLYYIAEVMSKVSGVTASATAALDEAGHRERVWRLAIETNRHCFAFFMPVGLFMAVYGTPLLRVWVSPEVAVQSGPLIPVLLIMFVFAVAGQYNSGAVLIGQGKHSSYAYLILTEVVLTVVGLLVFAPEYGALAAAWVVSLAFLASRGFALAFVLCKRNGFPFWHYLGAIYGRGLLSAALVMPLALVLRGVWPGNNWPELLLAAACITGGYYAVAYVIVLHPNERAAMLQHLVSPLRTLAADVAQEPLPVRSAQPGGAALLATATPGRTERRDVPDHTRPSVDGAA